MYSIKLLGITGEMMMIDLCNTEEQMQSMTVLQLKEKIMQKIPRVAGEDLLLVVAGRKLDGDSTLLSDYGIKNLATIRMLIMVPG